MFYKQTYQLVSHKNVKKSISIKIDTEQKM